MSERGIHLGILAGALALAGWVFGVHARPPQTSHAVTSTTNAQASPLALIPPGSAFVLTAEITSLGRAALGSLIAQRFGHLGSSDDLSRACGFDPLTRLDRVAFAVPGGGLGTDAHGSDFGLVASGRFSAVEIEHCAQTVIAERGGDPVSTQLGSFRSVRDRKSAEGEIAARDGGPLIVSGGTYFRELIDAAEGNGTKSEHQDARDARHVELRQALGTGAVLATWLLPEGWFERVAGDDGARFSPLRTVRALAAKLTVAEKLELSVLVDCGDAPGATQIAALFSDLRASLGALPVDPTLLGLAQRITLEHNGARLRLELALSPAELKSLLDTALGPADTSKR